jgi:hypothetical protein
MLNKFRHALAAAILLGTLAPAHAQGTMTIYLPENEAVGAPVGAPAFAPSCSQPWWVRSGTCPALWDSDRSTLSMVPQKAARDPIGGRHRR